MVNAKPRFRIVTAVFVTLLMASLLSPSAEAANRIFNLHLQNGKAHPIRITLSRQTHNCYEGTPGLGTVLPELQPGDRTTIQLARVQGHDCDGRVGVFAIEISGEDEPQVFQFDNEGHLSLRSWPVLYRGDLSDKSELDESYTYTYMDHDPRIRTTPTFRLKHPVSGYYLVQGYLGARDDKRNVEVQPYENRNVNNYRWFLELAHHAPGENYFYLVNLHTGLVLTQDGKDDFNVSNWGRDNTRQWWTFSEVNGEAQFTNGPSGMVLIQENLGRGGEEARVSYAMDVSSPGWKWRREDAGQADLCKLTIEKIKCIKPSTGKDAGTKILFQGIEFAVGLATGGGSQAGLSAASLAAKEAIKNAAKEGLKMGVKQAASSAAKKAGEVLTRKVVVNLVAQKAATTAVQKATLAGLNELADDNADSLLELAFDEIYGESPDQLEIRVNGVSVWPNGGRDWRDIKSQQTLDVDTEFVFLRQQGAAIQLIEYDYGSADDSLGWLILETKDVIERETYEEVVIRRDDEGSLYAITFKVEPFEWREKAKVIPPALEYSIPGTYHRLPSKDDWDTGEIRKIHDRYFWVNRAGASWSLTMMDRNDLKLMCGSDSPYYAKGITSFDLIVDDGKYKGFTHGEDIFIKVSDLHMHDMIGSYHHVGSDEERHIGSITPAGASGLNWSDAAGTSWKLIPAFDQDKLTTVVDDNPYHANGATEFKITKPVLDENGWINQGFVFGGEYYRRISSLTPSKMVGQFKHRHANAETPLHFGFIYLQRGQLWWTTTDGSVSWSLKPDFPNRKLILGEGNPFAQHDGMQAFDLNIDNAGRLTGFTFGMVGQYDLVPEITDEMIIGKYQHATIHDADRTGSIQLTENGLRWITEGTESWGLERDYANNQLITNAENPYVEVGVYQFKFIIINGEYKGFQFGKSTYHRK